MFHESFKGEEVSRMFQGCFMIFKGVCRVFQGSFNDVSRKFSCFEGILRVFQESFREVTCIFHERCKEDLRLRSVLRKFQSCFMIFFMEEEVSRMLQGCFIIFKGVSKVFQRCFKEVSRKFQDVSSQLPSRRTACFL